MDELFTQVSETRRHAMPQEPILRRVEAPKIDSSREYHFRNPSPEEALKSLRSEPDHETLVAVLDYLSSHDTVFDIRTPSPLAANLVRILVTITVPNFWHVLKQDHDEVEKSAKGSKKRSSGFTRLISCLKCFGGLSAVTGHLRTVINEAKSAQPAVSDSIPNLEVILELISALLDGRDAIAEIWEATTARNGDPAKRRLLALQLISIVGSSRIVSLAAEAEDIICRTSKCEKRLWIADSKQYSSWLALGIVHWVRQDSEPEPLRICAELLAKAFRLGHRGKDEPHPAGSIA
jgi:telomere length regulation protein